MAKEIPLTPVQEYVAYKLNLLFQYKSTYNDETMKFTRYKERKKAGVVRAALKKREDHYITKALLKLEEKLPAEDFDKVQEIARDLYNLEKYQGYHYRAYIDVMKEAQSLPEEELKAIVSASLLVDEVAQ